jgi:hypothetical protein
LKFILSDKERDARAIKSLKDNLRSLWFLLLAAYMLIGVCVLLPKLAAWLVDEGLAMVKTPTVWYEYPSTFLMYTILNLFLPFLFFSTVGFALYLVRYRSGMFSEKEEKESETPKSK